MWNEYENLTPKERLDKIIEILTKEVLRLIEEKQISSKKSLLMSAYQKEIKELEERT